MHGRLGACCACLRATTNPIQVILQDCIAIDHFEQNEDQIIVTLLCFSSPASKLLLFDLGSSVERNRSSPTLDINLSDKTSHPLSHAGTPLKLIQSNDAPRPYTRQGVPFPCASAYGVASVASHAPRSNECYEAHVERRGVLLA
jgi:hypothetical protein